MLWRLNGLSNIPTARSSGPPLRTAPVVTERRGSGAGAIVAMVIGLLAVLVIGYFLMNMSNSEQVESNAIAGAAESVSNAADNVGEAAASVAPKQ